ncbi:uncharacterized protein A1O5_13379 [Cladophialophora psammophila CBS 110553]|uniref:FAD-binding PCMH-type domain-containing protein n=1 Tax=Cladophialophora psammophila CBS 110553 TaxID=1182543 RepID=W9VK47_9EURO|nr:uncharacterized protein A1O5_13379 [Cladophialophora psammophila CBS 110553]EXJ53390.1 hypothetical protein A1O5_13379 [Cladophialophora psammophila CBS 110553]
MDTPKEQIFYSDPEIQLKHSDLFRKSTRLELLEVLPPKVNKQDFGRALSAFRDILGHDAVHTGAALIDYIDPFELWEDSDQRHVPSAAICPRSVKDIQGILKIANQYKIPLWTISRGKNLGYGGPSPRLSGSVVLDLHNMQKIIEVNDQLAYCVVEPGVTFFDLYHHCRRHKLKVWPSAPSLGWGSVTGNALDRGFGYTRHGDHHNQICGMEVVLPNGELIRTGQFAISNAAAAHLSKSNFGPSIDGLFLQSNLGVVTKIGLWMTPQPQAFMSCSLEVDEDKDIATMVDALSELKRQDVIQNSPIVRNIVAWSSSAGPRKSYYKGAGAMPPDVLKQVQKTLRTGYWMCKFAFYGPKNLVEERFKATQSVVEQRAPTARLNGDLHVGKNGEGVDAAALPAAQGGGGMAGVPDLWTLGVWNYRAADNPSGIGGHCDFSPTLPANGREVVDWYLAAKAITTAEGFDAYVGGALYERTFVMIHMFLYDKTDPSHRDRLDRVMEKLFQEAKRRGLSKYRSHLNHMDRVQDMYDFNNYAYRRFVENLKDQLDTNGILSPGKNGIWPEHLRVLGYGKDKDPKVAVKL